MLFTADSHSYQQGERYRGWQQIYYCCSGAHDKHRYLSDRIVDADIDGSFERCEIGV